MTEKEKKVIRKRLDYCYKNNGQGFYSIEIASLEHLLKNNNALERKYYDEEIEKE